MSGEKLKLGIPKGSLQEATIDLRGVTFRQLMIRRLSA